MAKFAGAGLQIGRHCLPDSGILRGEAAVRKKSATRKRSSRSSKDSHRALRKHLLALLDSAEAHLAFDAALAGIPPTQRGLLPPGAVHTAWQLLEHLRLCQWDILEFSRNPRHVSPEFPTGYWPATAAPPSDAAWRESLAAFRADRRAMQKLVGDRRRDLFARVNHPEARARHTLLREALLLADHNAYHLGQLVLLQRLLAAAR